MGLQHVLEVLGDLREHGQQRHARTRARRRERLGPGPRRQRRHLGQVAQPQHGAARGLERDRVRAGDRLEHEAVRHARAHLARDDSLQRLPLVRRRPRGQRAQPLVAGSPRPRALRGGDLGEGRRDVRQREGRSRRLALGRGQPAHAEHARVGGRKGAPRKEGDRGRDNVGRERPEELREQGELGQARRAGAQPPAELREPPELDRRCHSASHSTRIGSSAPPRRWRFLDFGGDTVLLSFMPRRVRYDATSRAAAAAAALLGDEFDVAPLPASTDSAALAPAVLLLGADAGAEGWDDRRLRVVALVEGEETGPWPAYWYALLPAGVRAPILARAVRNAFADIDHVAALTQLEHELFELNEIGIRLSAERNRDALLDTILTRAREITRSDGGSLYLVDEAADGTRSLVFVLAQNDSVKLPFRQTHLPLTSESVAGHVALTGEILNLADAYHPPPGVPLNVPPIGDRSSYGLPHMPPRKTWSARPSMISASVPFSRRIAVKGQHSLGSSGVRTSQATVPSGLYSRTTRSSRWGTR